MTLCGALAHTDTDNVYINPLQTPTDGVLPPLNNRPARTGSVFGQYDSLPIGARDANLSTCP